MIERGWYYLHSGGDLIWKGASYTELADLRESDFVVAFWEYRWGDREQAWTTLVEALAAGANESRVRDLAAAWGCDDADAAEYCKRISVTAAREKGGWFVVPAGSARAAVATSLADNRLAMPPVGRGQTLLEALAALARASGWQPPLKNDGQITFPIHLLRREVPA